MIAEELVTLLGVELSPGAKEKLQAFDKGLDAVVSRVKQASVVLTAAAGGMALYFSNAVNGAADLQTLSDTMGVSTTKLQEWAYAANAMGVSASAVQSDLAKMEKQARWTGRTLESYANQFKGMDAATANIWGDAYGLSPETVLLLRQGADGIAKAQGGSPRRRRDHSPGNREAGIGIQGAGRPDHDHDPGEWQPRLRWRRCRRRNGW